MAKKPVLILSLANVASLLRWLAFEACNSHKLANDEASSIIICVKNENIMESLEYFMESLEQFIARVAIA